MPGAGQGGAPSTTSAIQPTPIPHTRVPYPNATQKPTPETLRTPNAKQPHRRRKPPLATHPHGTARRPPIPPTTTNRQRHRRLHLPRTQPNHRTRRRTTRPTTPPRSTPHQTPKQTRLPRPPILEQRSPKRHRKRPPNNPPSTKQKTFPSTENRFTPFVKDVRNQDAPFAKDVRNQDAPFAKRKGARCEASGGCPPRRLTPSN